MPRPRGGVWLKPELASLVARGVTDVVSLLTPPEETQLELQAEPETCAELGLRLHRYPTHDGSIPQQPGFDSFVAPLVQVLREGGFIAIHCRAGIGRASLMAATLLSGVGVPAQDALVAISAARGFDVPDTEEQYRFIVNLDHRRNPLS